MSDSDNKRMLDTAGTLAGTESIGVTTAAKKNRKTLVSEIGTYVAGAGLPLTGSFAGPITGATYEVFTPVEVTVTGTMPATSFLQLNHASTPIAVTGLTPTIGQILTITQNGTGTAGHTVKTAGTFDGTNNTATFNAQGETLVLMGISSTRWAIILNLGTVGLTAT